MYGASHQVARAPSATGHVQLPMHDLPYASASLITSRPRCLLSAAAAIQAACEPEGVR